MKSSYTIILIFGICWIVEGFTVIQSDNNDEVNQRQILTETIEAIKNYQQEWELKGYPTVETAEDDDALLTVVGY